MACKLVSPLAASRAKTYFPLGAPTLFYISRLALGTFLNTGRRNHACTFGWNWGGASGVPEWGAGARLGVASKRISLLYLCFVNRLIFIISTLPVVNMVVFPLLAFFAHGFSMGIDWMVAQKSVQQL